MRGENGILKSDEAEVVERPTQAHDDTVAIPLRMQHMVLGMKQVISDHLDGFGILKHDMLFLDHALHKVLMNHLSKASPEIAVLHDE